jgi:hypothetical protein
MAGLSRNAAQKGSASASHAAVHESLNGPKLPRRPPRRTSAFKVPAQPVDATRGASWQ